MAQVWVASYGYRDCDAIGGYAAFSEAALFNAIDAALTEEGERSRDQCDGSCEPDGDECIWCSPSLWDTGPCPEKSSALELSAGQREELCRWGITAIGEGLT